MQNFEEYYQNDNSSPTFVFAANKFIENGNYEAAKVILLEGLQKYPNYPTAILLLSKAYYNLKEFEKALEQLELANKIIDNPKTYDYYKLELERIQFAHLNELNENNHNTEITNAPDSSGYTETVATTETLKDNNISTQLEDNPNLNELSTQSTSNLDDILNLPDLNDLPDDLKQILG